MPDEIDAMRRPIHLTKMTRAQQKRFEELIEEHMRSAQTQGEAPTQEQLQKLAEQAVRGSAGERSQ